MPRTISRATAAIIFVLSLLIIVFAIKSTQSLQSTQSINNPQSAQGKQPTTIIQSARNCKNMQTSIKIIDESAGKKLSGNSVETLQNSPFKTYITTVSEHVFAKIDKMPQCRGNVKNPPTVELFFVYRPLITEGVAQFTLEPMTSNGARNLDSPWIKLTLSGESKLTAKVAFIWSEQQILLDQALLAGIRASPGKKLLPISNDVFAKFLQDYTDSVLLAASPEARKAAQNSISERLPIEILWLFRHAWQSTMTPFATEVDYALGIALQRASIGYTDLTKTLVDQFLESVKIKESYESVLNLKDVFDLDKYRVNQLH
jgi:hypothetical protein